MQTHIVELTKQRLSDFFVKEDGHVAHKNALVAGTIATGAILASVFLAPDTAEADYWCGDTECEDHEYCVSSQDGCGNWHYSCI